MQIFGEAVLGLSQGSVSELLSKPKPWHMLSIKGREPFIRMQLWLADARNIEHIQRLKSERREAGKRRRDASGFPSSSDAGAPNSNEASSNTNSSTMGGDNSSNDGSLGGSPSPCGQMQSLAGSGAAYLSSSSPSPAKKQRILFSEPQKEALKLAFSLDPYPSTSAMDFLGQELSLSTRTITNWFHNHRMRLKQQQQTHSSDCSKDDLLLSSTNGRENSGQFDPIHFRLLLHRRLFEMQAAADAADAHAHSHSHSHSHNNNNNSLSLAHGVNLPPGLAANVGVGALAAGLPSQLNMQHLASQLAGMPYPFYATGMLSQFCMGLNSASADDMALRAAAGGLDLSLSRRHRLAGQNGDSADDGEGATDSESDLSNRTADLLETSIESRLKNSIQAMISSKSAAAAAAAAAAVAAAAAAANNLSLQQQQPHASRSCGAGASRRSRKPAAPQWVNPHWQQGATAARDEAAERGAGNDSSDDDDDQDDEAVDTNDKNKIKKARAAHKIASVVKQENEDGDDEQDEDEDEDEAEDDDDRRMMIGRRAMPDEDDDEDDDDDDDMAGRRDDAAAQRRRHVRHGENEVTASSCGSDDDKNDNEKS